MWREQSKPYYTLLFFVVAMTTYCYFRIDFLSLDVEGAEQAILENLPWDRVNIQSFLIEVT